MPKPATVEETKPFPIQSKTANYYTIQVGAFSSKAEAEKLKNRLKKKGYTVFINTLKKGKILYRVRVGRFIKRSDAEAAALKISINEKLKTFIVTQKGSK
ncbi:MAG: SPOR domain-containing protein [Nitrospirae bacterium]|nr:SPOR domain-containing protein [Nitrospirota bacterium]